MGKGNTPQAKVSKTDPCVLSWRHYHLWDRCAGAQTPAVSSSSPMWDPPSLLCILTGQV